MDKTTAGNKKKSTLDRNIWTVIVRVPDTRRVLHIAKQADRGIRNLRNGLIVRFPAAEALPLLEEYDKATHDLNAIAEKICEKVGVPYKAPKGMKGTD